MMVYRGIKAGKEPESKELKVGKEPPDLVVAVTA